MDEQPIIKTVLVLANSRKMSGRCIAGVELVRDRPAGWVRPVSNREHGEVSEYERSFEDGGDPRVLDVVSIPCLRAVPQLYQSENWLLDPHHYWVHRRKAVPGELEPLVVSEDLWPEGTSDSYAGLNDRVAFEVADSLTDSLRLILVDDLDYVVSATGKEFGNLRRGVQAVFMHAGVNYRLRVTDPIVERKYLALANGTYALGAAFLTVSLGEPYKGHVYKLVAAVIPYE